MTVAASFMCMYSLNTGCIRQTHKDCQDQECEFSHISKFITSSTLLLLYFHLVFIYNAYYKQSMCIIRICNCGTSTTSYGCGANILLCCRDCSVFVSTNPCCSRPATRNSLSEVTLCFIDLAGHPV